ncbi:unnamed protein product, partial [marine sediment metagenome]
AIFTKLRYLTAAFAKTQKQAQSKGANNQPGRDKHFRVLQDDNSSDGSEAKAN